MIQRSNIGASLNRKRQASHFRKILAYFVFVLFFISLAVWGLTTDKVRIKDVIVSGNSSVPTLDILQITNMETSKYYLWIIPTNNIFLLRQDQIENDILSKIKKINSVKVSIGGIDKIEISVTERKPEDLWCAGNPATTGSCYFMDSNGFIFENAGQFSTSTFPVYFGLIKGDNPIGQLYFKNNFNNISNLFGTLKKMSFEPQYFNAIDEHEYEVYLSGGGKILFDDEESFGTSLTDLQALVDNNYVKTDSSSVKKINYIDLRFGSKVNFQLNK